MQAAQMDFCVFVTANIGIYVAYIISIPDLMFAFQPFKDSDKHRETPSYGNGCTSNVRSVAVDTAAHASKHVTILDTPNATS